MTIGLNHSRYIRISWCWPWFSLLSDLKRLYTCQSAKLKIHPREDILLHFPQKENRNQQHLRVSLCCNLSTKLDLLFKGESESVSRPVKPNSFRPHGLSPIRLLCPWDFPGKNTGIDCCFLLQGIFLTQGSKPGLLHCRQILYHLSHKGYLLEFFFKDYATFVTF